MLSNWGLPFGLCFICLFVAFAFGGRMATHILLQLSLLLVIAFILITNRQLMRPLNVLQLVIFVNRKL